MATSSPTASRSGLRRALRSAAALLAGVLVTTCADNPTSPNRPGFGSLRVQPAFDQNAIFAPLLLNQVRAIVVRPPADTVIDTLRAFNTSDNQLRLALSLALQARSEQMEVTLQLLSGQVLLFSGTELVEVRQGASAPATSIPVTYSGPGANATSLELAPADTVLRVGSTAQMRATARDADGLDVGQFYLSWSLVGTAPGATVDASGLLHAPTAAGTFFVRGITPGGLRDSVQVTAVPAPATLAKTAGDNQTALPGQRLPLPLTVLVTGAGGVPVPGVAVTFAATTGGGAVDSATATTNAQGIALSGVTLGQTAGAQTFTVSSTGLTAVVFTATAGAPPAFKTWTGVVSTDWSTAGNWTGGVPGATDSAVIVAATNLPQLSTETSVGALTINSGVLRINGQGITIGRNLTILGGGLQMTNANDQVVVGGNATFGGADATTLLTNGELTIAGNFAQLSTVSPFSFAAGGSHITLFTTGAHSISFASPGAPSGSGFADLEFAGNGTTTFSTATWVRGTLDVNAAGQVFSSTTGSRLGVELLVATAPVTFNNVPLVINQTQQTSITNQPLTFQNMATNVVQLEINHPGSSSPLTLNGFIFSTTPVAPNGFYLDVNDNLADANPLVINMTGATPGTGAPFVRTSGGAAVNWSQTATLRTWTGAINSDWTITNNWAGGVVPVTGDDVLIPDAPANPPLFSGSVTLRNLTIESESGQDSLTVNGDGGIGLSGNLTSNGRITGSATLFLVGPGPHAISGEISRLTVDGNTTVQNNVTIPGTVQVNSGIFNLGDDVALTVGGDFRVINSGTLQMNNSTFLQVAGNVEFLGASTAGLLTGGTIQVGGNFTAGASDGAYAPDAQASVSLTGTGTQVITLGSTASYFANLAFSKSAGSVQLASDVTVFETLGDGTLVTGGHTITAGQLNSANMIFDGVRLVWNATSAAANAAFSQAIFRNYAGTPPQFTVNHPGLPTGSITFDALVFQGTPQTFHLLVNDNSAADGNTLTVNLTNATPADGTGLYSATNGAVVNWPPAPTTWAWTGTTSTNWSVAANWDRNSVPPANAVVTIGPAATQPTLTAPVTVQQVTVAGAGARLTLGGQTLTTTGDFVTHTDGLLVSTNTADRLIVNGNAAFQGGDETGLITAGELRINGDFTQQVQTSPLSFLASGSHRTIMTNTTTLQGVRFCCTANSSKFMNLDISNSFGINIQFAANGVFVADTFIVQPGAGPRPWLYMLGSPLQARRFKINRLLVDRGTLTLNEGGVAGNQQLDSVTFQNYLTTQTQLAVTAVGGSSSTRTLPFTNLVFQALATGNTGRYVNVTSSSGTLALDLTSANVANGPAFTTVNGSALVNWPGATTVNTWSGAVSTAWTTAGNWSLGRIPVATDSVVIPNAVTNFPTLTGRQVVGAMFEDGRLTINGGVLVVTRSIAGNTGVNRIIQTTLVTDSLIVTGSVATPISTILGVVTIGGDLTASSVFNGARLLLNGAASQNVAATGGLLIVNKPTGTATLTSDFNGDSIDVISGNLDAPSTNITVATGLSSRAGTSVSTGAILQVGTNLTVLGTYTVNITRFKPQLAAITIPALTYTNIYVEQGPLVATVSLGARTVATADVVVTAVGTDVTLNLNGHTLDVGNNLSTGGLSIASVRMNNPLDSLLVNGNVTFSHASGASPGNFTAGVLRVGGFFTQSNTQYGGPNFQSTGTHKVILTAFNPTVRFDNTGTATNQARFNDLTWTGGGTLTWTGASDSMVITGTFTTTNATSVTFLGAGVNRSVRFTALNHTGPVVFSQTRVIVAQPAAPSPGTAIGMNNVTFQNTAPSVVALTIQHPGFTGGLSLNNLTFNTVPSSGGFYISATDNNPSDGLPLAVNVTASSPATPGSFTSVAGGATITWPFIPTATWTGAVNAAWDNAGNWDINQVPSNSIDVVIPSGTPFNPTAGGTAAFARNLTVNSGATMNVINPFSVTVSGNVDALGTIAGNGINLNMTGANVTLRGNVPQLNVTGGAVTLSGAVNASTNGPCVFTGAATQLIVNGFTFNCFQTRFDNGARLQMTNVADSLSVTTIVFNGGDTEGRLTAGAIEVKGSFQQLATGSPNGFVSTGTRVRFNTTGSGTVTMQNGGPTTSRFTSILVNKPLTSSLGLSGVVEATDSVSITAISQFGTTATVIHTPRFRAPVGTTVTLNQLQVNGSNLNIGSPGSYAVDSTVLVGTGGTQAIPVLPYRTLVLDGSFPHVPAGRTVTTGPLFIHAGNLVPSGRTVVTGAGFVLDGTGALVMNNPVDSVLVGGNAFFTSSANHTGLLTAGVLRIASNLSVGPEPTGFVASGTHKTIFASTLSYTAQWTGLGIVPIQFQDLEVRTNPGFTTLFNWAQVNGNMSVTGTGGMNVSTLNVRGLLSTTSGMGIDSLFLGGAVPFTGGGSVNANVYIFDGTVAQTIPTLPVTTANVLVRSNATFGGPSTMAGLRVQNAGQLDIGGQVIGVDEDFATSENGVLVMQNAADRLNITGATTFAGGNESSLLTDGILRTSGRFTQDGSNSNSSFVAVGNHQTHIATNYPGGNTVSFSTPQASAFFNLRVSVPTTFGTNVLIFNDFLNEATGSMPAQRVAVQGNYTQNQAVTFTPKRFVYYGTLSTGINVTAGSFQPDTIQFNDGITTVPVNGNIVYNAMEATGFGEVNLGATAPAINSLLLNGTMLFKLNGRALNVNGLLRSTTGTILGTDATNSVTARQLNITAMIVDNARLILNEQGTTQSQTVNGLTFQNLTAPGGTGLFTVTAVGNNGTPRTIPLGVTYNSTLAGNEKYLTLASSNTQSLTANVTSNVAGTAVTAANGATPTIGSTVNGATIVWP